MPKKKVVPIPKNLGEASKFLAEIGKEQRAVDRIKLRLNEKVDSLKDKADSDAGPHAEKIDELVEGLFAYAETNREELTNEGKKRTVDLPSGFFAWRLTPPAVKLRDVDAIIRKLKSANLKRFIRVKEGVNKEAMLKEPEVARAVKGVSIVQREEFVAKPAELEVELISSADKLRKKIK